MFLYQQKPERVEAVKLTRDNSEAVASWCGGQINEQEDLLDPNITFMVLSVPTFGEVVTVGEGDYVVKDREGRFKTGPSIIFEALYEPVAQ